MTITFHIAHHDGVELTALTTENAPTLNVRHAGAAELLAALHVAVDWAGELDASTVLDRLDQLDPPTDPVGVARRSGLRAVALAAAGLGRKVAWE